MLYANGCFGFRNGDQRHIQNPILIINIGFSVFAFIIDQLSSLSLSSVFPHSFSLSSLPLYPSPPPLYLSFFERRAGSPVVVVLHELLAQALIWSGHCVCAEAHGMCGQRNQGELTLSAAMLST